MSLTSGFDIIINAADNQAVLPCIRATINNHAHYCDMAWADILENALQLEAEAATAGITAMLATGISPCISNLICVHAAGKLDEIMQFQIGRVDLINFAKGIDPTPNLWFENPKDILAELHDYRSFIEFGFNGLQKNGKRMLTESQHNRWMEVDPIDNGLIVPLAQDGSTRAYPYFSGDVAWGMAPTDLAEQSSVEMRFSPFPNPLDALLRELAKGVLSGEIDPAAATSTFYANIELDPSRWLTPPEEFSRIAKVWVRAVGRKGVQAARSTCWFTNPMWYVGGYFLTSVALVAAVGMILRGEIQERGVMTAEKAFDPLPFLNEVAAIIPGYLPEGEIIDEAFEWME